MRGKINILDCTLREAGYLNNWQFSDEYIRYYINLVQKYGVDVVEIGFRYNTKNVNYGICAYCPDDFVNSLDIPNNLQVAVMIKSEQFENKQQLRELFNDKKNSRVDIVRVASHYQKAGYTGEIIEFLREKGYKTSLNITKLNNETTLKKFLEFNFDTDMLYFADTYGTLSPRDIKGIFFIAGYYFNCPLGFHGHNNKGLALENTLAAIESGATYIDSTINGVGKGYGNLKTEDIVKELKNEGLHILQNCK